MPLVTLCWVSCDGQATHPGGVEMLLVTFCWVSCDGLATHPGGAVILLVTLCWVSCDGLASHPGGVVIHLVTLCCVSCDGQVTHRGVALCWVSCDVLASHPGLSCNHSLCSGRFPCTLLWISRPKADRKVYETRSPLRNSMAVRKTLQRKREQLQKFSRNLKFLCGTGPRGVVLLQVTLCWERCDRLATHPEEY